MKKPSIWLIIALASFIVFNFVPQPIDKVLLFILVVSLSVWSFLQLFKQEHWLRKGLGIIGFGVVFMALIALVT